MSLLAAADFEPAWWLPGGHAQTIWPNLARRQPAVTLRRQRLELPDGDFLDLDWTCNREGALVLLLHGLGGSSQSTYIAGMLHTLQAAGLRAVVMHFRGCSGEPNRLDRSYHAGDTADLARVMAHLEAQEGRCPDAAIGYSLGGNVLLKWLGETARQGPLPRAVAVSVPFDLSRAADRLDVGLSRLYQRYLLRRLQAAVRPKLQRPGFPLERAAVDGARSFREFDDHVTAPLHGFRGAEHYYRSASSRPFLSRIQVPTLAIHAVDDPFLYPDAIPAADELGPGVTLELSASGGHVGFVTGPLPGLTRYWLEQRIVRYLQTAARKTPGAPQASDRQGPL